MNLLPENDPLLKTVCHPFDFSQPVFDPVMTVKDMTFLMRQQHGIGLAAPQVGLPYRLFIVVNDDEVLACFNPEIIETAKETLRSEEGCLSFPDLWLKIIRPQWLTGRYQDINGEVIEKRFVNLYSASYQHELNHLDGICFTSLVGPLALKMALNRRIKRGRKFNGD